MIPQESQEWRNQAACAPYSDDLWFPDNVGKEGGPRAAYAAARLVCDRCPVKRDCLEHALAVPERAGMWGGLTPKERHHIRWQRGFR